MKKSLLAVITILITTTMAVAQEKLVGSYTELYVSSEWVPYDTAVYYVNLQNRLEEKTVSRYDGSSWQPYRQEKYAYTQDGKVESITYHGRNSGQWVKESAIFYTYNTDNTLERENMAMWYAGKWQDTMERQYTYNGQTNPDNSTLYFVDFNGHKQPFKRAFYFYDNNDRMASLLNQNLSSSGWVDAENFIYTYNSDGYRATEVKESLGANGWVRVDSSSFGYTEEGGLESELKTNLLANVPVERTLYQYSLLVNPGSVADMSRSSAKAFPNPFNESLSITFEPKPGEQYAFSLYDMSGKELKHISQVSDGRVQLEREGLASGMYYYKITTGSRIMTGQVIAN